MKLNLRADKLLLDVHGEAETEQLGKAISEVARPGTVIALVGTLGAGKTRLSRAIAESLGVDPLAIASPTFVLIHEYQGRIPVFHFDTYRLGTSEEFEALGAIDYFEAGGVCLVEWADRVPEIVPPDAWWVRISLDEFDPACRQIEVEAGPAILSALAHQLDVQPLR